mmetsp:Transcript_19226/g.43375  ORF Transcript_19226/g.43375 Transcript_19226/m.43375 type:complete len:213 (-) Transcript_19226:20-658(-)
MSSLASSSLAAQTTGSPALGRLLKPTMRTGWDGLAFLIGLFPTSLRNLTRPACIPETTKSPLVTLPHRMIASATTPSPFSIRASITIPSPCAASSARRSIISDCNPSPSMSSSSPSPVRPDTGKSRQASSSDPPTFSVYISCVISWFSMFLIDSSTSIPGLSTLLTATTRDIDWGWAFRIDLYMSIISTVWGDTPSSAAITKTMTSVADEPD